MKYVLLALGAGALYWAYRNGAGAIVGACPPGFQPVQDMLPGCRNSMEVAGYGKPGQPTTRLPFPFVWGWNGTGWQPVQTNPQWPAPAPPGLLGYRRNYRRKVAA